MAAAAKSRAGVNRNGFLNDNVRGITVYRLHMVLTRSVAGFTLDAFKDPGADNALKSSLVSLRGVTGSMAATAGVWLFLAGVIV